MTDYLARSLAACASNGVTARAYESEPTPRSRAGSASGQAATARPPDPTEARCLSPSGAARAARLHFPAAHHARIRMGTEQRHADGGNQSIVAADRGDH